ncbi:glycoside hydrolase family 3 N-terminal domain-containing protein [Streptomyces sp. SL13]|uniref:beta-N-acetylhexosaminidase n=1 Tax=Streptantibioticus silvisoli TaxID=2705255 RepID=A0AA90K8D2_9ACTN|nr:glycoside hydrolase family 3 N-terminal domain-containing protein [Streptantibioticus silvisoli]MDI5969913.1 glycoside hydrolase family 3 N-terminal domain-containing protein [Streptantibioticus silvisoli]
MRRTDELREQIELLVRPGSVDLMPGEGCGQVTGRIAKDVVNGLEQLREVIHRVLAGREPDALPLLVSANQEGGRLNALDWAGTVQLPGNLALGATDDATLAKAAGAVIGGQLRAVGLTWNLAPVCDLASWPSTSAVGTRSFGTDPARVAELAGAFVHGLQGAGVAATAKHFPGLGSVAADPHHTAPVVDELPVGALLPFRASVDAGVACVMAGSHTVRSLDDRPAFASQRVIELLRDELGFDGVVVSENLSLPAVHGRFGGVAEAAVEAVAAGVDIVMFDSEISRGGGTNATTTVPDRRAVVVDALTAAVETRRIDRERIEEAAARVHRLHQRYGVRSGIGLPPWAAANSAAGDVASRVAEWSVAVVRGRHLLPISVAPGRTVGLVRVPNVGERRADSARNAPDLMPAALGQRVPVRPVELGAALPADCALAIVHSYDSRSADQRLSAAVREAARLTGRGLTVVQIAFGDPDDLAGSPADVLVAAFAPHREGVTATVDILLGSGQLRPARFPVEGSPW